ALENYLAALKIFTELDDKANIAECCDEAGSIFMETENYLQASEYFMKALEINKKLRNLEEIAINYSNIGNAYVLQDSIDKGLSHYLVALMIADSLKYEHEVINLLNKIGEAYVRLQRYPQAADAFERAASLSIMRQNQFGLAQASLGISKVYYHTSDYPRAIRFALKSNNLAKSENFNRILHDSELLLSQLYASTGNYQRAFDHYTRYKVLSDSIFSDESSKQLAIMQAKYELEAKEKENQILRLRNLENQKTIARKNRIVLITTSVILASVILVLLLLYVNKRFRRLNQKLAVQSEKLKNLNMDKDRFFAYVVHNIKNPFSTIWGFSELLLKHASLKDTEKMVRYSKYIYDSSAGIKEILGNLLEWSRLLRGKFEYKPVRFSLEGLIKDVIELNNKLAEKNDIVLSCESIENKYVYADRQMVYTILQNLLSNAIKYNVQKGKVIVSATRKDTMVEIAVSDTGSGIPAVKMKDLFVFDPANTARNAAKPASAGMGLVICHELVTKNGGEIMVESIPGKGSRFTFTLPVPKADLEQAEGIDPEISEQIAAIKNELRSIPHFHKNFTETLRKELIPKHSHVSKVLSVEELKEFASLVVSLADEYQIKPLKEYGQKLLKQSESLQFDEILKTLPEFSEIANVIIY
ncbi:MAG TPA: ATP-binding protein, partial [Bacteroidales bacterium]|nr:ATP-binding protein [Bacteroidales bacterium]